MNGSQPHNHPKVSAMRSVEVEPTIRWSVSFSLNVDDASHRPREDASLTFISAVQDSREGGSLTMCCACKGLEQDPWAAKSSGMARDA